MLKLNKKGFTIVELVIVIAVVAILAAVLIPTFIGLMQTAKTSADIQLVTSLNKVMAMQEALDGKNGTMYNALQDAKANGYDLSKLTPTSEGNDIVWDQSTDRFALVNPADNTGDNILFWDESLTKPSVGTADIHKLWKIYDKETGIPETQTYSIYWGGTSAPEDFSGTVSVGVDTGKCSFNISYISNAVQDVIFRTNGGTLTVDNTTESSHQTHYGTLTKADIKTASNCFITHGQIAALELKAGKAIADKGGYLIVSSAASGTTVEYANGGIVTISANPNVVGATVEASSEADLAAFVIEIKTAADLAAFRDSVNSGMTYKGLTVKLTADIDLSSQGNWNPIGNRYAINDDKVVDTTKNENKEYRKAFMGTFDGQGHMISGLFINTADASYKGTLAKGQNTSSYAALFGYVDKATVKNFTVNGLVSGCDVAGVIGILGDNCTVDSVVSNVTVGGQTGENEEALLRGKAGGIINMTKGNGSKITNCTNNGDVRSDKVTNDNENRGDYVGGIIALIQHTTTIENCKNTGAVTTKNYHVGGIVGGASVAKTDPMFEVKINNCENTGDITCADANANDKNSSVGAIIGLCGASSAVSINSCTNAGSITGGTQYDTNSLVGASWPSTNGKAVTITGQP